MGQLLVIGTRSNGEQVAPSIRMPHKKRHNNMRLICEAIVAILHRDPEVPRAHGTHGNQTASELMRLEEHRKRGECFPLQSNSNRNYFKTSYLLRWRSCFHELLT